MRETKTGKQTDRDIHTDKHTCCNCIFQCLDDHNTQSSHSSTLRVHFDPPNNEMLKLCRDLALVRCACSDWNEAIETAEFQFAVRLNPTCPVRFRRTSASSGVRRTCCASRTRAARGGRAAPSPSPTRSSRTRGPATRSSSSTSPPPSPAEKVDWIPNMLRVRQESTSCSPIGHKTVTRKRSIF